MEEEKGEGVGPIFRDIRRYYCEYCGICRSKKALIATHISTHHKDVIEKVVDSEEATMDDLNLNTCEECGASFKKPAHLKQHMQSHSLEYQGGRPPEKLHQVSLSHEELHLERPFICAVDDCSAGYRRKDHLNRHLLQHEGKLFKCPVENCNKEFQIQSNMNRHVKNIHGDNQSSPGVKDPEEYACQEPGCGKVFKFLSKLQKHEESHVKLDSTEAFCSEPGCMQYFTNDQCLKAHVMSCHQHINCAICGTKQLRKNIKRHLRMHEGSPAKRFKCDVEDCLQTFSNKSNLRQHVKVAHEELKPFVCGFSGCGMRFSYKHVRDKHEKSGCHVYTSGDFLEADEQFRSKPRGGQKRQCPTIDMLVRKRVTPPCLLGQVSE